MRNKLRGRIVELYGTQSNFCEVAKISKVYLSMILKCESNGSYNFWNKIKMLLNIPDSEIEEYKKSTKSKYEADNESK